MIPLATRQPKACAACGGDWTEWCSDCQCTGIERSWTHLYRWQAMEQRYDHLCCDLDRLRDHLEYLRNGPPHLLALVAVKAAILRAEIETRLARVPRAPPFPIGARDATWREIRDFVRMAKQQEGWKSAHPDLDPGEEIVF